MLVCKSCRKEVNDNICWNCGESKGKYFYTATHHICLDCLVKDSHKTHTDDNQDEWIECRICGYRCAELSTHLKTMHGILAKEYGLTKSEKLVKSMRGEGNPSFDHGGRLSPFSNKFINYKDEESRKSILKKQGESRKANGTNPFTQEYHDKNGTSLSEYQTRDLKFFIDKYGDDVGKLKHKAKTEKWMQNFPKANYSKISQEVFDGVAVQYSGDIYYATYERSDMTKYANKEYILPLSTSYCRPDFICLIAKKVIEFDGDYWHSEAVANPLRDSKRDSLIIEQGFTILHIKECDYIKDKQGTLDKCIQFLTQ